MINHNIYITIIHRYDNKITDFTGDELTNDYINEHSINHNNEL